MKFKTVAEAFNFYRNKDISELEKRAKEIGEQIDKDSEVDIEALNIELKGIKEAKENIELRSKGSEEPKLNIVTQMNMESNKNKFDNVLDTPEYRSAFFKNMLGQKLSEVESKAFGEGIKEAEKRADAFTTSTDVISLLPTSTLNEIIKKARTIGGLIGECRAFNMPTKISIPIGTPSNKATWHTEGAEVESEKPVVSTVVFDGYEIIKVFSISAKTRRMSITAFESYLVDELTSCVMETIADALINGTGNEQGTGLENGITWTAGVNLVNVSASKSITSYQNVIKTISLLKRGYAQGAKWAMNNSTLYNIFYGMIDNNGRPIFIADPRNESVGKILGFDIVIDDNIADNVAYLGNYRQYLGYNMPEGIVIETSRESSFKKGLIDYRALAIADTKPIVEDAFIKFAVATA